jgi:hypothetical protein
MHHQIATIKEILDTNGSSNNPAYRVLGTISSYDIHHNLAILSQPGSNSSSLLILDSSLLPKFAPKESSLYEIFGEVEMFPGPLPMGFEGIGVDLILRARMLRNVDGLDLELYDQVELLRRKFVGSK